MRLSTQERLQSLHKIEVDNIVRGANTPKEVVLSFTPRVIVFQNFRRNEKSIAKFCVKNISKVCLPLILLNN